MVIIYDIIFVIFSILCIPYLIFRRKGFVGVFRRMGFGLKMDFSAPCAWIHAVSVGEVQVASLLARDIKEKMGKCVVVSTITPAGNNLAQSLMKDYAQIIYAPLDISFIVNNFFKIIKPSVFIMVETELWPNLITAAYKKNIPVVLINGRISPRSFRGYSRIRFLTKLILNKVNLFCMQTEEDKEKIVALGALPEKVQVTGNMKFDNIASPDLKTDFVLTYEKLNFSFNDKILIAGSTHPLEEEMILAVYKDLIKEFSGLKLLIAPRHIERAGEIEKLVGKFGFNPQRFSTLASAQGAQGVVLILDVIGKLRELYRFASVVFIGGSLIKKGGQNIIEPALFAKPIIFGPHMFNFAQISASYLSKKAALQVKNKEELKAAIREVLSNPKEAEAMGRRGREIISENKGATARNVDLIFSTCGGSANTLRRKD